MGKSRNQKKSPAIANTTATKEVKKKQQKKKKGGDMAPKASLESKLLIDDLFNTHKINKKANATKVNDKMSPKEDRKNDNVSKPKADRSVAEDDGFFDTRGAAKARKVIDGHTMYTLEELGVGKGGDTNECPFDCKCCF